MSIRLSIYDFFAYTIPGGIILAIALYIIQKYQVFSLSFSDLSTLELLGLGIFALLAGYFIDPIAKNIWYKIFRPKNFYVATMTEFNKRNPDIEILFKEMDWYISFAYIKRHSAEMAQELEHVNVISIMLRNCSFGLLIFSIVFAFEFFSLGYLLIYAIESISCFLTAIVLVKQAVKFNQWFYEGIYQSLIALVLVPEQLPVKFEKKSRISTSVHRKEQKP